MTMRIPPSPLPERSSVKKSPIIGKKQEESCGYPKGWSAGWFVRSQIGQSRKGKKLSWNCCSYRFCIRTAATQEQAERAHMYLFVQPRKVYFTRSKKGHKGVEGTVVQDYEGILLQDHESTFYQYGSDHQECLVHVLRYLKARASQSNFAKISCYISLTMVKLKCCAYIGS